MFTRFTNTIVGLKSLGKIHTNVEMERKILRCMLKSWEPKVTTIKEVKDLNKLSMDELMGSLITDEVNTKGDDEEDGRKKRGIALKWLIESDDNYFTSNEDDVLLMTRRFTKFFKTRKQGGKRFVKKEINLSRRKPQKEKLARKMKLPARSVERLAT